MVRKLLRLIFLTFVFMTVLVFGGTSLSNFVNDTQMKSPMAVYQPLLDKLGIDLSVDIDSTIGNSAAPDDGSGKVEVNADNKNDNTEKPPVPDIDKEQDKTDKSEQDKQTVTKDDLTKLIGTIRVSDDEKANYDRALYEKPIKSYKLNGKKYNRNDYAWKTSEYLESENPFKYSCPYTGLTITDDAKLDYDHIIPLHYVWNHTDGWSQEKMNEYAYDQSIGVDVQNSANRSKSDKGPSGWLPAINVENYCYTWLCIASEWDIAMDKDDINICKLQCLNAISSGHNLVRID